MGEFGKGYGNRRINWWGGGDESRRSIEKPWRPQPLLTNIVVKGSSRGQKETKPPYSSKDSNIAKIASEGGVVKGHGGLGFEEESMAGREHRGDGPIL